MMLLLFVFVDLLKHYFNPTKTMPKNEEYIFKCVQGIWKNISDGSEILAETLTRIGIVIDDECQFCRIIRYYDEYICTITYRAYNQAKITIHVQYNAYI